MIKGHNIKLKVWNAELNTEDDNLMGKQDPYIILSIGQSTHRTSIKKDGGKNPIWNETFDFSLLNTYKLSLKLAEKHVEDDDFTCQAEIDLQSILENEDSKYDKETLELFDRSDNVIGTITVSIVQMQEYQIKRFNLKLNVVEAFLSKVTSDYFNDKSVVIKIVWNENKSFKTNQAKFIDKKAEWNQSFDQIIEREDTIGFFVYEFNVDADKLYDDYIASAELSVDVMRTKKSHRKDLTLMSRKNKMLGSLTLSLETDLDEEDIMPANQSFLQQSLDSSIGGNSMRGLSRDMVTRKRMPVSSRSPKRKNMNECTLIELDSYFTD